MAAVRASDGARLGAYSTILRTSILTSTTATDFYTCSQCESAGTEPHGSMMTPRWHP